MLTNTPTDTWKPFRCTARPTEPSFDLPEPTDSTQIFGSLVGQCRKTISHGAELPSPEATRLSMLWRARLFKALVHLCSSWPAASMTRPSKSSSNKGGGFLTYRFSGELPACPRLCETTSNRTSVFTYLKPTSGRHAFSSTQSSPPAAKRWL